MLASLAFVKQIADLQLAKVMDQSSQTNTMLPSEEREILDSLSDRVILFDFNGPLSFGAAADLGHHVREKTKTSTALIIDFSQVPFLDVSAARAVATISEDALGSNKKIFISGMNPDVKKVVLGLQEGSVSADMFFESRREALEATRQYILASSV